MAAVILPIASTVGGWVYSGLTAIGVGAGTASTVSIYATTAVAVGLKVAGTAVISGLAASAARPDLPDPEAGKIARRQSRPIRTVAVGGPSRFSGWYMFRETNGPTLGTVLALNDGRLASIDAIYLNDDKVTLLTSGFVQGGADGRYGGASDLVQIKTRLGNPAETWFSEMGAKFGDLWTEDHRGDGIASLMMLATHWKKEQFNEQFPNGEPIPSVVGTPVCYDWRDETQSRADQSTWKACDNPIVWLVFTEWHRLGMDWRRRIEPVLDALTVEADYCDAMVAKIGGTEKRYPFAGWYAVDAEPATIRAQMLSACDGWVTTDGLGRLVVKAGRYEEPTFTLSGEHITGYNWRAGVQDEEAINVLRIAYVSPEHDFTEVECDPWSDEADILKRGRERPDELKLQWVNSHSQARRLAKRKMSRLQAPRRGQIVTDLHGLNGLGQRYIRVQNPELSSMADVVVEVMQVEVDLMSASVTFDVIQADPEIDEWNPATEEGAPVSAGDRPAPEGLETPDIDSVTPFAETGGVRLNVVGYGPDRPDLTWYVRWRSEGSSWVEGQYADSDPTGGVDIDTGFIPEGLIDVQIAYTTGSGTLSPWGPVTPVTVDTTGLTATTTPQPSSLSATGAAGSATVSWRYPTSPFAYTRVKQNTSNDYASATELTSKTGGLGALDSSTLTLTPGTYWFWIRAFDADDAPSAPLGPVGPITVT